MPSSKTSTSILIDTNIIVASSIRQDKNNARAIAALSRERTERLLVVSPVLVEVFYLVATRISYDSAIEAIRRVRSTIKIISLEEADMIRMEQIMERYRSAHFDYADTAIMAVAERLNITRIMTFDRRDFSIYRPTNADTFELLP